MASISRKRNADGSHSLNVAIFVKPWRKTRSFCEKNFPSRAAARDAAERWSEDTERELRKQLRQGAPVELPTLTIGDALRAYLADPETHTLKDYRDIKRYATWWIAECGSRKVLDAPLPLIVREAREKLMPGREPATVNGYLRRLRSAWNWGRATGLIPTDRVFPPRALLTEPRGRTRFLDDDELKRLLDAAKACSAVLHAAIMASLATGCRKGELLRLVWQDIDFQRQTVRFLITKSGRARAVHLPPVAAQALRELKAAPVVGRHVFLNADGKPLTMWQLECLWRTARRSAELNDFRWHDLRHSAASLLAQNGASLVEIGSVLGHSSPAVTLRYSHLVAGAPLTAHTALDKKLRDSDAKP